MRRNMMETVLGAVVLLVAGFFLVFAYQSADIKAVTGYEVQAQFTRIAGLGEGSDVRISGVKVGTVTEQSLDHNTYFAVVKMVIDQSIELPADTSASIVSESLLGGKYVALEPGGDMEMLKPGDMITNTQGALDLESLLGQAVFGMKEDDSEK